MARSRGVTVYGTYAVVIGFVNLVGNLWLAVTLAKLGSSAPIGPGRAWMAAVANGLLCAAGVGAFLLKPWGRTLAMLVAVVTLALVPLLLSRPPAGDPSFQIAFYLGAVAAPISLNAGILWFFTRPTVAAQFHAR